MVMAGHVQCTTISAIHDVKVIKMGLYPYTLSSERRGVEKPREAFKIVKESEYNKSNL